MRAVTKVPAIILLVVLALLPLQAWLAVGRADVRIDRPLDELQGVTWAGTIRADGQVAVSITYDLRATPSGEASIRLPDGARLLTVDGRPAAADSGKYGTVDVDGPFTVGYEISGRVTRYDDGVVVDFSGLAFQTEAEQLYGTDSFDPDTSDADQGLFPCARCYLDVVGYGHTALYGALYADSLDGSRIAVGGVDQLHVEDEGGAVRFVAELQGAEDANLVALLPLAAAPDAPTPDQLRTAVTPRGPVANAVGDASSAREAYDSLRGRAERAGIAMGEASSGAPIGKVALALILSAMWILIVVWIVVRIAAARRALAADRPHDAIVGTGAFSPPSTLEPALVSVVVGGAGPGDRSITAATLLALAHRGVIRIEGLDSERYTLTVPMGARGSTTTEEAVLDELRPQGQTTSTATFSGPPLWGDDAPAVARRLKKVVIKEAHKAGLLRVTLAAGVLVPASLAMGIVALVGSQGDSVLAWIVTFAGPVVAFFAAALTGVNLTARGRAERDRWVRYGEWLRENSQLREVGAPGIVTWGEPLIYATVLGAAPKAANALGVRGGN
jgi:hypothetical protein